MTQASKKLIEKKIYEKWIPAIEERLKEKGLLDRVNEEKKKKIAKLCHTRKQWDKINESYSAGSYATPLNVPGRGAFSFGNNPGNPSDVSIGSGEVFQNLFGLFVDAAASTFGMDLLPNITMSKSNITVYIYEPIYTDGKINANTPENKLPLFQVQLVKNGNASNLIIGNTYTIKTAHSGGENVMEVTYVGKERIHGYAVFRLGQQYDNSGGGGTNWKTETIAFCLAPNNGIYFGASDYWSFTPSTLDYVNAFNNFVAGHSGSGPNDNAAWYMNRNDGNLDGGPNTREVGEGRSSRSMGLRQWSRNFSARTQKVDIEYTLEQIQDARMDHDTDAIELGDAVMQDQLSQSMNDYILQKIYAHGWSNHYALNQINGFNLNAFLGTTTGSAKTYRDKDGVLRTISGPSGSLPGSGAISENLSTLQRRVITRMLYSSAVVNTRCRRGRGDTAILNGTFSAAVQDIRGFRIAEFENDINDNGVAHIGSFNKISCYEDNLAELTDERIAVFRKGTEKDPGLKLGIYLLAYKTETTAEGNNGAPKHYLVSRYEVIGAGSQPQLNYLTFTIQQDSGYKIV
jgi:hypothetical protein